MSVKVISYTTKISADSDVNIPLALRFMVEDIERISKPFTPKDKGFLRNDVIKSVIGKIATITWNTEYAEYQEDKQYAHYTTPGTGPHYAENAVSQVINDSGSYFRKAGAI